MPVLRSSVGALESFLSNEPALNSKTRDHLRHVFTMYNDLIEEDPQTFRNNGYVRVKTFAPIELIAVAVLISQHGLTRPRGMLLGDIRALREHLRSKNFDLRTNKPCWSSAWEFIDDLEGQRGTVDGSTVLKKVLKPRQAKKSTKPATPLAPGKPEGTTAPRASETIPPPSEPRTEGISQAPVVTTPQDGTNPKSASFSDPAPSPVRQTETGRLAVYTARVEREGTDRVTLPSRDEIENARHNLSRSTSPSAASAADSLLGGIPPPEQIAPLKRRPDLDLGSGSTGARALAAKKARLMGKSSG